MRPASAGTFPPGRCPIPATVTVRPASTAVLAVSAVLLAAAARSASPRPAPAACHGSAEPGDCSGPEIPGPPVRSCIPPPERLQYVRPVYPAEAKARGVHGLVILELWIDALGRVSEAKVLRSVPLLDAAAIEAARQWTFRPTCLDGTAVPVVITVAVPFDAFS
jgi:periplasmic protein TonB